MNSLLTFQNPPRFIPFSITHWVILFIAFFIIFASPLLTKLDNKWLIIIANFISWGYVLFFPIHILIYLFWVGSFNWAYDLPILQICGVSSIATAFYLFTKNKGYYLIAYFWGFGAMLASFLTPALLEDFPHIYYYLFWGSHLIIIFSITFIYNIFPKQLYYRDIWKAFGYFLIYIVIVYPINLLLNANYGFLLKIPDGNTFLDIFGAQWSQAPYYYLPAIIIIISLFHILYFIPIWFHQIIAKFDRANQDRNADNMLE